MKYPNKSCNLFGNGFKLSVLAENTSKPDKHQLGPQMVKRKSEDVSLCVSTPSTTYPKMSLYDPTRTEKQCAH